MTARFRPGLVPTLAAAVAVAILCNLGAWQVRRLHWKQALLAEWNARIDLPPVPVEEALTDPEAFRYRRATALGRYDHERSILVVHVPRGLQQGARVLTPLRLASGAAAGSVILVDRGWIPDRARSGFLARDRSPGPVEVTGLVFALVPAEAPPASREPRLEWRRFDPNRETHVSALRAQLPYPLAPVLLQRQGPGQDALPMAGFERPRSRVDHRSYAITWFSMAAIAVAVWIGLGIQQGRLSRPRSPADPAR